MGEEVKEHFAKNKGLYKWGGGATGLVTSVALIYQVVTPMLSDLPKKTDLQRMELRITQNINNEIRALDEKMGESATAYVRALAEQGILIDVNRQQIKASQTAVDNHEKEGGHQKMEVRMDAKDKLDKEQWDRIRFYHGGG